MATTTIWGPSQHKEKVARGIMWYSTASHGGYHLSKKMNEKVPLYMRRTGGWYEEDCDWAIVVTCFPRFFNVEDCNNALKSLKEWHWREYELFFGVTLKVGESKRKDEFVIANKPK